MASGCESDEHLPRSFTASIPFILNNRIKRSIRREFIVANWSTTATALGHHMQPTRGIRSTSRYPLIIFAFVSSLTELIVENLLTLVAVQEWNNQAEKCLSWATLMYARLADTPLLIFPLPPSLSKQQTVPHLMASIFASSFIYSCWIFHTVRKMLRVAHLLIASRKFGYCLPPGGNGGVSRWAVRICCSLFVVRCMLFAVCCCSLLLFRCCLFVCCVVPLISEWVANPAWLCNFAAAGKTC